MKVLQLCKKSPTPQKDGESIAIHQITKALQMNGANIDVLAMLTPKHPQKEVSSELHGVKYQYIFVDTQISPFKLFLSLFEKKPYIVNRFNSKAYEEALKQLLSKNSYDVILLEGIFLGLYLPILKKYSKAKIVLRAHNVENQIWKRFAVEEKNRFKKIYLHQIMNPKFEAFEEEILKKVAAVVSISPIDNQYFISKNVKHTLVLPVALETVASCSIPSSFEVGFLGGLDWLPNRNGVEWFLKNVWSKFITTHPEAVFNLAGRNFPKDIYQWEYLKLNLLGEIDSASEFIQKQSLMIVPIFSGSGMRVKIIEAMSHSKCVLSTQVGAEGIKVVHKENIYLAENKEEWLQALELLYEDRSLLSTIGQQACALVDNEYDLRQHAKKLLVFLESL